MAICTDCNLEMTQAAGCTLTTIALDGSDFERIAVTRRQQGLGTGKGSVRRLRGRAWTCPPRRLPVRGVPQVPERADVRVRL